MLYLLMLALVALVYVHKAHTHTTTTTTPDAAFLASFATPPTRTNVRVITPQYATPQVLLDACAEAVAWTEADEIEQALASLADECESDMRHLAHKIEYFAHTVEQIANGTPEPVRVIEHKIPAAERVNTSTERMRAQRAAYAAQGLTARGTVPQPPCNGTVADPSNRHGSRSCKRKSVGKVEGWTKGGFCSYEHAAQYGLERVWAGEETMEQAKARMTKV